MLLKKIAMLLTLFVVIVLQGCQKASIVAETPAPPTTPAVQETASALPMGQETPSLAPTQLPTPSEAPIIPTGTPTTAPAKPTLLSAIPTADASQVSGWLVVDRGAIDLLQVGGKGQRTIFSRGGSFPASPFWAPDGQWIAFTMMTNDSGEDIYIIRPDGGDLHQLTNTPTLKRAYSWSPDGKSIVFSQTKERSQKNEFDVDLYILDIETRVIRQLTDTPGVYEHDPVYSPKGDVIAFTQSSDNDPNRYLMFINPDGSNLRNMTTVTTKGIYGKPSWSPDGSQIVFSSEAKALYIVSSDGSNLQQLTDIPGVEINPAWSPDGNWIAFIGVKTFGSTECVNGAVACDRKIFLVRPDGSDLAQVPTNPVGNPEEFAWAPLYPLTVGDTYTVTESGAFLNLRSEPSLDGESLAKLDEGEEILVLEGPVEAGEYLWWQVRVTSSNLEGWVAETPGWFREK